MSNGLTDREILFYYRNGCHLCEEMAAVLHQQWPDLYALMQWRDVDANPIWQAEYGVLIPLLMVDQVQVCNYIIDPRRINACFSEDWNPV